MTGSPGSSRASLPGCWTVQRALPAPDAGGRFPAAVDPRNRKLDIAADIFIKDIERLEKAVEDGAWAAGRFRLVGLRLQSNNNWIRNLPKSGERGRPAVP